MEVKIMKRSILKLKHSQFIDNGNDTCECIIDLLPAYAISYTELSISGFTHFEGNNYRLDMKNSKLIILYNYTSFINDAKYDDNILYIDYFEIRDYSLLFPKVMEKDIAIRLGNFYEEAEKCFENNTWLSYSLMCAAIFEGMLFSKYKNTKTFNELINDAFRLGDIDKSTYDTMHLTRDTRNLVHTNNYTKDYISRINAMDIRTTMDNLIKEFKY
jgi:hypothetical protein